MFKIEHSRPIERMIPASHTESTRMLDAISAAGKVHSDITLKAMTESFPDDALNGARQLHQLCNPEIDPLQLDAIAAPQALDPDLDHIMAVHWHPEQVAPELALKRFRALYPAAREYILIPTQHNRLTAIDGFSGVEIDCRWTGGKLQLLAHFHGTAAELDAAFLADLERTRRYRNGQLQAFLAALTAQSHSGLRQDLAHDAGLASAGLAWAEQRAARLGTLLAREQSRLPQDALKNKLVRDWLLHELGGMGHPQSATLLRWLGLVKEQVKRDFPLDWFLPASEWIARIHELGGTVTLPHPEFFWDALEAGLPLDGVEVWNPQSWRRSEELLAALVAGRIKGHGGRPVLPTFGDDCHLGEKLKPLSLQDEEKSGREIGWQPAWDWPGIATLLAQAGWGRRELVREWITRLKG